MRTTRLAPSPRSLRNHVSVPARLGRDRQRPWRRLGGAAALALILAFPGAGAEAGAPTAWPFPDPPVTPPAGHPRVFLRAGDLPALRARFRSPRFHAFATAVQTASADPWDGHLREDGSNYTAKVQTVIEACALRAILEDDPVLGRRAVELLCRVLPALKFPEKLNPGAPPLEVPDKAKGESWINGDYPTPTRMIGATITTTALVYDWCFPWTNTAQRKLMSESMKRLAAQMEVGYPPLQGGAVTGHTGEAQLLRDQLAGGIAVFDEDPEMYRYAAGRIFADIVPVRNFIYPAHWYHQGSGYGIYRYQWELWTTLIFTRMGLPSPFSADQIQMPYAWIYGRRPDGQVFEDGDCPPLLRRVERPIGSLPVHDLAAAASGDPYILRWAQRAREEWNRTNEHLAHFLFAPAEDAPADLPPLPLTRYFGDPAGVMIARTGWADKPDAACAMVQMKIAPWMFNNHQHLDAGHFQVWYKGALACASGLYKGTEGSYGSSHFLNYYQRTIAHNTITVLDPDETFAWQGHPVANDGGQHWPDNGHEPQTQESLLQHHRTGTVTGHAVGPDARNPAFSYLAGDLGGYGPKVGYLNRSFIFLRRDDPQHPATLAVYDRIRAAKPEFVKTWRMHTAQEPSLGTGTFTVSGSWGGRLDGQVLLPRTDNVHLIKDGGPGREFLVGTVNFPQSPNNANLADLEEGGWRVELSPVAAQAEDRILVVLQVGDDRPGYAPLPSLPVTGPELQGFRQADQAVVFPVAEGQLAGPATIEIPGTGDCTLAVAGVASGTWTVVQAGHTEPVLVTDGAGLLLVRVHPGSLTIRPAGP
jgi:Heparinase II/III-like protein